MVQWLGLCTLTAVALVQSLLEELRSRKLHGVAKKNKKKRKRKKECQGGGGRKKKRMSESKVEFAPWGRYCVLRTE